MTELEAAEIILGEEPVTRCNTCYGKGTRKIPITKPDSRGKTMQDLLTTKCSICHGKGSFYNHAYAEACKLLGLPIPVWPVS